MNSQIVGILVGGSLIASLGSLSTYSLENKNPTIKSVSRDFIIGAILFMFIMYLLPESTENLLKMIMGLLTVSLASQTGSGSETDELEVQVGVPKF
jgi:hypothetical protein